jgi:FlaA1/EpsC-like NDP-sugar epimerase
MGVDEAIDAVLYSLAAKRGAVVIPKMQAMTVADVARLVLELDPGEVIESDPRVHIVGARPGEKLHEALLHEQESVRVAERWPTPTYYELRPSIEGATQHATNTFCISSADPPLGWMRFARMEALIEDAATL